MVGFWAPAGMEVVKSVEAKLFIIRELRENGPPFLRGPF